MHARFSPRPGSIEQGRVEFHVGDENAGRMKFQFADNGTIRPNREAGPTRRSCCAVVGRDPDVILGCATSHRRRNNRLPDVVFVIGNRRFAGVVEGLKQNLHPSLQIIAIEFRKPILVTDGHAASDPFDLERHRSIAGRKMSEIERRLWFLFAGTKAFIVAVDNLPAIVDHIQAVMWFVCTRQSMRRPKQGPKIKLFSGFQDSLRGGFQFVPIKTHK